MPLYPIRETIHVLTEIKLFCNSVLKWTQALKSTHKQNCAKLNHTEYLHNHSWSTSEQSQWKDFTLQLILIQNTSMMCVGTLLHTLFGFSRRREMLLCIRVDQSCTVPVISFPNPQQKPPHTAQIHRNQLTALLQHRFRLLLFIDTSVGEVTQRGQIKTESLICEYALNIFSLCSMLWRQAALRGALC